MSQWERWNSLTIERVYLLGFTFLWRASRIPPGYNRTWDLDEKSLKRLVGATGAAPITLNLSKEDKSGNLPFLDLINIMGCAIPRTRIFLSKKIRETRGIFSNPSSMWYPTNKTGPSEGIPARPFTIVPSSKVESITALAIRLNKLEVL